MPYLTEEEARGKWCPFSRDYILEDNGASMAVGSFNRPFPADFQQQTCNCLASQCAVWRRKRWGIVPKEAVSGKDREEGYCGLAGKPQEGP